MFIKNWKTGKMIYESDSILIEDDVKYCEMHSIPLEYADLSNQTFLNFTCCEMSFQYAKLNNTVIYHSNFIDCNLSNIVAHSIKIMDSKIVDTSMRGAIMNYSIVSNSFFTNVELDGASLRNALLRDARFRGTDLSKTDTEFINIVGGANYDNSI